MKSRINAAMIMAATAALLFLGSLAFGQSDWKYVGRTGDSAFSIDYASIKQDGDFIYFISGRADIKDGRVDKSSHAVSRFKATCSTYKFAFLEIMKKKDGKIYHHEYEPEPPTQAEKGSMIYKLISEACLAKRSEL